MIRTPARLVASLLGLILVSLAAQANDNSLLNTARNADTGQAWFDYLSQCGECSARREALGELQAKQYAANGNLTIAGAATGIDSNLSASSSGNKRRGATDSVLLETARQSGQAQDWVNYLRTCQLCNGRGEALGVLQKLQLESGGSLGGLSIASSTTGGNALSGAVVAANTGSEDDLLDNALIDGRAIDWYSYLVGCSQCAERDTALNALQLLQYNANGDAFNSDISWVPGQGLSGEDADAQWADAEIEAAQFATLDTAEANADAQEIAPADNASPEESLLAETETAPANSPEINSVNETAWDDTAGDSWGLALETSGHSRAVWRVAFSPAAPILASASGDRSVIIYDLESRDILHRLEAHTGYVNAIAFSPDGKLLASGAGDRNVIIWNVATGTAQKTLKGHQGDINALVWSASGDLVLSGSDDGRAIVWDSSNGAQISQIQEAGADITAIAVSPDETTVATAGSDGNVRLYDSQTGNKQQQLASHDGYTFDLAWSVDGKRLTAAGSDGAIRQWNLAAGGNAKIVGQHPQAVTSIEFSANGDYLASSSFDGKVTIRDASNFSVLQTIKAYPASAYSVAMTGDGRFMAAAGGVKFIRIWRR